MSKLWKKIFDVIDSIPVCSAVAHVLNSSANLNTYLLLITKPLRRWKVNCTSESVYWRASSLASELRDGARNDCRDRAAEGVD